MNIDVYTKDGELVEIHYIVKRTNYGTLNPIAPYGESKERKTPNEFYILLDKEEPRFFCLNEGKIEKTTLDVELFDSIMKEAQRKFKGIRLQVLLNPDEEPAIPPVLSFLENKITKENIKTIKEELGKKYKKKRTYSGNVYDFVDRHYHELEYDVKLIPPNVKNYFELHFYIPECNSYSSGVRVRKPYPTEFVDKIRFDFKPLGKNTTDGMIQITKIS
ncbi:hypothetical protein [Bacillus cereus]|uniref:hypothetical protein n=1 Tax=Bacillus cereus TaxID=1396 RepID=UPI000BEB8ED9|nr:hypothetical protein [Bacillus cereus]PDY82785.1 hypothetical protein CON06_10300 [Bacillus cereus]